MNGLTLAYIGDAYYELEIRKHLIEQGYTQVKILHNRAIKYTSGIAQAKIIERLINEDYLNEDELSAYKRGRNNSSTGRKNLDAKLYVMATGFEAVIGYLFLNDKDRLNEFIDKSIMIIEEEGF
ncbi:Mini-ribonuclease 3 [Haploplasma axanthum]|uniref:Mini-ribonuclease 3 n=1 Tax=Haploplasma axanthum TaxID=29552 RepID=A0A449BCL4_HAPAX|nr:ribonuclease III domain-containing protein [Haploplasma axanthum]VEU80183.1 Mini-ribonuclease 3 [Haploplasma axanthum]